MTMQTTPFPFQVTGATSLQQAPQRNAAAGVQAPDPGQFRSTLSREIAQRQSTPAVTGGPMPVQSPDSARKPVAANKAAADKPAVQGPKAPARAPEKPQNGAADAPATAQSGAKEVANEGAKDAAAAAAAADSASAAAEAATTPVTDMLAFMASLAQPVQAAPAAGDAQAAGADLQLAALQSAFAALETGDGVATDPALAAVAEGDTADTGFSLAAGVKADVRADLQADVHATARDATDLRSLQQAVQADPKAAPAGREGAIGPDTALEAPAPALTQLQAQASKLDALAPATVPTDRIPARVGSQAWDNQVSQRIVYMVGKEQAATLTLNPPDLGPVQVVLNVSNEGTSVAFSSGELEVRQALENALPRLRDMMSESGITLGNATVDAGKQQERQAQDGERRAQGGNHAGADHGGSAQGSDDATRPATRTVMLGDSGLVDTFA